jgi:hypothetical protein
MKAAAAAAARVVKAAAAAAARGGSWTMTWGRAVAGAATGVW